ncbi:hypothetical protein [Streptosporangium sp. NPDC051022]|uniref:hypothetical protein n=1 Tax=Streptosporangium sp. NPDC051022 TaxID=3155752 RepID=UPI00343912E7
MSDRTAHGAIDDVLRAALKIDWTDAGAAYRISGGIFDALEGGGDLLATRIREVIARRGAGGDCESYEQMDKLVLWQSEDRSLRLRLHVFHPGFFDRPHNHRWSFVSRILTGGYLHSLYGSEETVAEQARAGHAPLSRFVRQETPGTQYFLEHSLVHSLSADRVSVSLLLRGPSVKDDYFTWSAAAGRLVQSRGAAQENTADRAAKTMPDARFDQVLDVLVREGIV